MMRNPSIVQLEPEEGHLLSDPNDKIDLRDWAMLQTQIEINKYIKEELAASPIFKRCHKTKTVNVSEQTCAGKCEAIIKYFRHQTSTTKKTCICMRDCKIDDRTVDELITCLLDLDKCEIEELDLSLNHITDRGCEYLAKLVEADRKV